MPWKLGCILSILLSAVCLSQESKTGTHAARTASISGTVLQSTTQTPLKNVQVTALHNLNDSSRSSSDEEEEDNSPVPEAAGKTDEKGHFEFLHLPPGTYFLRATRPGMVLKSHHFQAGVVVQLEAGKAQTVDLIMAPTAVITGQVLNEDGEPMRRISVRALRYSYTLLGRQLAQAANASTDDQGRFRLFDLAPGSYLVSARAYGGEVEGIVIADPESKSAKSHQEQTTYTPTYYPNQDSPSNATPIVLKAGDEAQANFILARVTAHSVSGRVASPPAVKSATGRPEYLFRMVYAMKEGSDTPLGMTTVARDSTFEINSLPPGRYTLMLDSAGGDSNSTGSADVVVESSDVTGVVIAAQSTRSAITGRVRADEDAKLDLNGFLVMFLPRGSANENTEAAGPFVAAPITFYGDMGATTGLAEIKADGTFASVLPSIAKPLNVTVVSRSNRSEDWFVSNVLANGKDVLDSGLTPADAQAGPIEIVLSNKVGAIEGIVVDKDQKPFPGADIVAFAAAFKTTNRLDMAQTATADQQGHFKLHGLRPGEYTILALENSQEQPFMTEQFQKTNSGKIRTVKSEAARPQQVQLEVIRLGR